MIFLGPRDYVHLVLLDIVKFLTTHTPAPPLAVTLVPLALPPAMYGTYLLSQTFTNRVFYSTLKFLLFV